MTRRKPKTVRTIPETQEPAVSRTRAVAGPWLVAAIALVSAVATIAPEMGGPGIACDEPYHVLYGKWLVWSLRHEGIGFFSPAQIRQNFDWKPGGAPVHPPLGNWLLGWTHHQFDSSPDNFAAVSVVSARMVTPLCFGLLVLIVGLATTRWEGPAAGTVASAAVFLVPRVFGHAHLAALDLFTALTFVGAALALAEADSRGGKPWRFALAGVVWGLALLTRLHGFLLLPPVAVWLIWRHRLTNRFKTPMSVSHGQKFLTPPEGLKSALKAVVPLLTWFASGMAVLYAGWPWLWLAPVANLRQFLQTGTDRLSLPVFYLGQVWADTQVPRHYAIVMFLVTLPVGFLLLGLIGIWAKGRPRQENAGHWLLLGSLAFVLILFSLSGTPVYDGERLFLMAFPLWAAPVGIGAKWLLEHRPIKSWRPTARIAAIGGFVVIQGFGIVLYHPCYLSYYNLLVGGLSGAERLGFEVDYWGDGVTEPLLNKAARVDPGGWVAFAPNLAPFQAPAVQGSSPSLVNSKTSLTGGDQGNSPRFAGCRYAVLYNRKASLDEVTRETLRGEVIEELSRQGVWIARIVKLDHPIPYSATNPQSGQNDSSKGERPHPPGRSLSTDAQTGLK